MADEVIALTQDEIDRVLNAVRTDNKENSAASEDTGVALTQDELEKLFSGSGTSNPAPAQETPAEVKAEASLAQEPAQTSSAEEKAAKIAERKARMEAMLAQANASSPKRISVIYGSTLKTGAELNSAKEGTTIALDRLTDDLAEIFVDGKLYARGKLCSTPEGNAAVKITQILDNV